MWFRGATPWKNECKENMVNNETVPGGIVAGTPPLLHPPTHSDAEPGVEAVPQLFQQPETIDAGSEGWKGIQSELLSILGKDTHTSAIDAFHTLFHSHGVQDSLLLTRLAYLQSEPSIIEDDDSGKAENNTNDSYEPHAEAVRTVAAFLVDPAASCDAKLACLNVILQLVNNDSANRSNPQQAAAAAADKSHDDADGALREALAFCVAPRADVAEITNGTLLLWELRAVCLYEEEKLEQLSPSNVAVVGSTTTTQPLMLRRNKRSEPWENVKEYLFQTDAVLLKDLDVLRDTYNLGVRNAVVLASVGYLRIEELLLSNNNNDRDVFYFKHNQAVRPSRGQLFHGSGRAGIFQDSMLAVSAKSRRHDNKHRQR